MADQASNPKQEIDSELLTAYLDGELSDSECIAVEKRLAEDPSFHQQMRELQSAWEMLDSLPLVQPDSHFVQTTIEMAIAGHKPKMTPLRNLLKGLLIVTLLGSVFGLGYFLTRESIEQPERELVNELPLVENHDRYKEVIYFGQTVSDRTPTELAKDGIVFLKSLYSRGLIRELDDLFSVETKEETVDDFDSTAQPPAPQQIKDRSDRLSRMTEEQREELFDKKRKFESLSQREQETLREFHNLLSQEPDRIELVEMLNSYYDWLKVLGASQQAQIKDTPLDQDQRLIEIDRITSKQAIEAFGTFGATKLPPDDAEQFYHWYGLIVEFYELEIRKRTGEVLANIRYDKGLSTNEMIIDRIKSGPIEQLVVFLMKNDRDFFGKLICNHDSERQRMGIDDLRSMVSDATKAILDDPSFPLEAMTNKPRRSRAALKLERQELILIWIEVANRARFPIKTETLKGFYTELTQEQRDELDNQDPKDRYDKLSRLYWEANIGQRTAASEEEEFQKLLIQSGLDTVFGVTNDDS